MNNGSTRLYNTLMGNPNGYNAVGRTAGGAAVTGNNDNFFVKRAKSIENTFGTTGAAIASKLYDSFENASTDEMLKSNKARMNEIAKKYGYNTYQDVWDARDKAEASGDKATLDLIDNTINPELQAQANANAKKADEKAAAYNDYRKNNYVSQKINQDRGKFLGSAINTLSTATDVALPGAGIALNAAQGAAEGVADELEQNGLENFDWGRAGQNAAIGATTGAVTGALNRGLNSALAKNGGNLFKGNNAITRGLNNLGSKTALGRFGSTIATGAGRGALSGAVGGATGAGLQSAINGVDLGQGIQNTVQGAVQGAKQGAVTGGIMAGTNMALSKTPGVGNFMQELNEASQNWKQSGRNFDERLTNTLTSGDSAVGDWIMNKRQSNVLGAAGNLGNRISPVGSPKYNKAMDLAKRALNEFEQADPYEYEESMTNMAEAEGLDWNTTKGKKAFTEKWLKDTTRDILTGGDNREMWAGSLEDYVDAPRLDNGVNPINGGTVRNAELQQLINDIRSFDQAQTPTTANGTNKYVGVDTLGNRTEYTPAQLTKLISDYDNYKQSTTLSGNSFDEVSDVVGPAGSELMNIYKTMNGGVPVDPYSRESWGEFESWLNTQRSNTPTTAKGWAKKAGQRIVEDINNSNLGNRIKDVSSDMPEDIRNMQIRDYNADADGEDQAANRYLDDTPGIDKVRNAFENSANQRVLTKRGNTEFALGDFGRGNMLRKADVNHSLTEADITNILDNSDSQSIAGDSSFRKDNIAWFGNTADGERATVITRPNAYGQQEVINAYKNNPGYEAELVNQFGTPAQSRTGNLGLEGPGAESAARSNNSIVTQNSQNVNTIDPWDRVAQEAGYSNYDEVIQRYMEANPDAQLNPRGAAGQILTWLDQNPNTPTTASGWLKEAGNRAIEDINDSSLGMRIKDVSQETPETKVYRTLMGQNQADDLEEVFRPIESDTIQPRNKLQSLGEQLETASKQQKYAALYGSLNNATAERAIKTNAPEVLAEMGIKPENYLEAAKTSNYINRVISDVADESGVKIVVPDLPTRLKSAIDNVILTDEGRKNYNQLIQQIVADGSSPDEYSAGYLLEKSREIGNKAATLRGNSKDVKPLRSAYTEAKYVLRDLADNALADAQITNDTTNAKIAQGLAELGANQKVIDYYTKPVDGKAPSASDYIRRSSYFEQARDMGTQVGAEQLTRSASKEPTRVSTKILRASGLEQPLELLLKNTVAPAASLLTKGAGKVLTGAGNLAAKIGGNGTSTTVDSIPEANVVSRPEMRVYDAIGRNEALNNAEQARTAGYITDATQSLNAESGYMPPLAATTSTSGNTLESLAAPATTTNSTSVYNSLYGDQAAQTAQPTTQTAESYFPTSGNYWVDVLGKAMTAAINADDVTAFAALYGMYQDALSGGSSSSSGKDYSNPTNWNSSDRTKLISAQNALSQIDELENAYNTATGSQGGNAIQGNLRTWAANLSGGNLDPSASNYNSLAQSVGMGIVKNLINLGVTESDAERYVKYLPSLTDTKEQAAQKLATLRNIYQSQINNLYGAYGV